MTSLDPNDIVRNYPGYRAYSQMLQDLIGMYDKVLQYKDSDSDEFADALFPAVMIAKGQLSKYSNAAAKRLIGGEHVGE